MTKLERLQLAARVVIRYVSVRLLLATRRSLSTIVDDLGREAAKPGSFRPGQLNTAVEKILRLPGKPLRCLPRALVLYSLLAEQGHNPRLAIGLPELSSEVTAHAWVELDGVVVGPSPGRDGHLAMAMYPLQDPS